MSRSATERFAFFGLILLSVFFVPWWLFAIFMLAAIVRLRRPYELLLPALFFDLLYSAPGVTPFRFQFIATFLTLVAVYLAGELKAELRV